MWVEAFALGFLSGGVLVFALMHLMGAKGPSGDTDMEDDLLGIHGLDQFRELATRRLEDKRGVDIRVLAMVDVDQFKTILADRGEKVADQMLVHLGDMMTRQLREEDLFARIGRREFAIVFQARNMGNVNTVLDRLRMSFSVTPTELGDGEKLEHTLSIGYTIVNRSDPSLDKAMARASQALDTAKSEERNCIRYVLPDELDQLEPDA